MTTALIRKNPPPLKAFPLRIQRCGANGWFFIACDDIPGLSVFGAELEPLFRQLETAGAELLRLRGIEKIELSVEVVPATTQTAHNDCSWADANKFELRELRAAA